MFILRKMSLHVIFLGVLGEFTPKDLEPTPDWEFTGDANP